MAKAPARLFLSEVDTHHSRPLKGLALRNYLLGHVLFFDRLLIGDSQFNNNPHLRYLLWDYEPGEPVDAAPRDMWLLLSEDFVRPVTRSGFGSLDQLRREHLQRGVKDVPSAAYVEYVEGLLDGRREEYDLSQVSYLFKERVLTSLSRAAHSGRGGLGKNVCLRALDYVRDQEPLLFRSFRDWLEEEVLRRRINPRGALRLDRLVADSYRHNVAISLGTTLDVPLQHRDVMPHDIVFGDQRTYARLRASYRHADYEVRPTVVLSKEFLSRAPASLFTNIRQLRSRQKILRQLEAFRNGKHLDLDNFLGNMEGYLWDLDFLMISELPGKLKSRYRTLVRRQHRRTAVRFMHGSAATVLQLLVPGLGPVATGYQTLHAGYGALKDVRKAGTDYLQGYILGRSIEVESLLVGVLPPPGQGSGLDEKR